MVVIGELEAACVPQHVRVDEKGEFRRHARPGHHALISGCGQRRATQPRKTHERPLLCESRASGLRDAPEITAPDKPYIRYFLYHSTLSETVMPLHSTVLIALILLIGATVPSLAEEGPNQTFTCTAKTFNECLMEAPCSAWKRSGPKAYKLDTKIIFRGNPVEGETISGGTIGDVLETKCGNK